MAQHPIPQQISSYEFKLVGEMTLKQFFKAAAGIILALLINATKIHVLLRWPLMLASAGIGLAFAFIPYQDKPLEYWLVSFFKVIFTPTIYLFQKDSSQPVASGILIEETRKTKSKEEFDGKVRPLNNKGEVKDFINNLPSVKSIKKTEKQQQEKKEEEKAQKVSQMETIIDLEDSLEPATEENWRDQKANLNLKTEKLQATGKAVFGKIPMPDIPEIPNLVVGMVTDAMGKIIDGAIVEIQDQHGNSARVLKTNSLGQFRIASPLQDGEYLIICEYENHNFDRVNINLNGNIVQPIRIISNN